MTVDCQKMNGSERTTRLQVWKAVLTHRVVVFDKNEPLATKFLVSSKAKSPISCTGAKGRGGGGEEGGYALSTTNVMNRVRIALEDVRVMIQGSQHQFFVAHWRSRKKDQKGRWSFELRFCDVRHEVLKISQRFWGIVQTLAPDLSESRSGKIASCSFAEFTIGPSALRIVSDELALKSSNRVVENDCKPKGTASKHIHFWSRKRVKSTLDCWR